MVNVFGIDFPDTEFGVPTEFITIGLGAVILLGLWPIPGKTPPIATALAVANVGLGVAIIASKNGMLPA